MAEELEEQLYDKELLDELLEHHHIDRFREVFLALHIYEQGEYFTESDENKRSIIYQMLSPQEVAEFVEQTELENYDQVFETMDAIFASQMLSEMSYDNAVDILNELPKAKIAGLLLLMDKEAAGEVKALLHYEEDTAGGLMTTEYISVSSLMTVREAMLQLKEQAPSAETIYYIFIVNDRNQLVGVISLRDLIVAENDAYIEDVMNERVISVNVADDQEDVAMVVRDYDLLALPVVDYQNHLLGIITIDDIVDVIDEEASEDYSKLAGVSDIDSIDDSVFDTAKKRLPWLAALTIMGMGTATILGSFQETLEHVALLAAFIPIIGGMAGNSGTQSLAVVVRGISTGEIEGQNKVKLAIREAGSGLLTGFSCAFLLFAIICIVYKKPVLAVIVAVSLTIAMTVATLAGALVPIIMHRINIDPAVASGPFISTINDIISMLIYFGLATTFMSYLS
ncbi:magnesium transporter [Macrococcus equipercicus]|uniref:Magnesium transporter MgtE n=1 Tax=Macrococcus equipercicus TaxID=69967 RepID=A0A9Q9BW91_9STAP|nr:magnesium transporter [Macrococcus equipercicus]UTH14462.1 magnesium transporter [Macrococcus equipercicus]